MATIALEGIHFYAYHGFYEEEQIIGNEYVIDVYVNTSTFAASVSDDLFRTVNYETLYLICQMEMRKKHKLLETVAQRILDRINAQFDNAQGAKVRVRKLNPPIDGCVDSAYVEVDTGRI